MKKYTLALVLMAVLPMFDAAAYNRSGARNSSYYSSRPVSTSTYKTTTATRRTGGHINTIQNNFYYTGAAPTGYYTPNSEYAGNNGYGTKTEKSEKSYKSRSSQMRKFFLAHPFFQPLKGRFGSVTDLSYAKNSFNFDLLNAAVLNIDNITPSATYNQITPVGTVDVSGKAETSQILVKEDFSYGLSDTLSIVGMLQYDKTKMAFKDWSGGEAENSTSDSGLNIFGIGLQNRFIDNDKWIAMLAGFFQHQKDTANTFIGEMKAGYIWLF